MNNEKSKLRTNLKNLYGSYLSNREINKYVNRYKPGSNNALKVKADAYQQAYSIYTTRNLVNFATKIKNTYPKAPSCPSGVKPLGVGGAGLGGAAGLAGRAVKGGITAGARKARNTVSRTAGGVRNAVGRTAGGVRNAVGQAYQRVANACRRNPSSKKCKSKTAPARRRSGLRQNPRQTQRYSPNT
jgi:hypothetical protein